jgi:hypothetical protein
MVEVIIVNYNTEALLRDCLSSLFAACPGSSASYRVTVVDNASKDDSLNTVRRMFPQVKIIANITNRGFAGANNQAMAESDADYFFLLNSDTIVLSNVIDGFVQHMEMHPKTAIAGCKLVLPDGTRQVGDAGYRPTICSTIAFAFFLSKIAPRLFKGHFHHSSSALPFIPVDWVAGAALFVRREFVVRGGPMSEAYFMYAEDMEWGLRSRDLGWDVHYLPLVEVNHFLGGSIVNDEIPVKWLQSFYQYLSESSNRNNRVPILLIMWMGFVVRTILYDLLHRLTRKISYLRKRQKVAGWASECWRLTFLKVERRRAAKQERAMNQNASD